MHILPALATGHSSAAVLLKYNRRVSLPTVCAITANRHSDTPFHPLEDGLIQETFLHIKVITSKNGTEVLR